MNANDQPSGQNPDSSSTPSGQPEQATGAASIGETVEKVRQAAATTAEQAKGKAAEIAGQGKNAAADKVAGYSDRLRQAARSAEENEDPNIAHFAGQAADRLEQVADYVRDADFTRLRDDATQVARRHPALFMGGMLVAGLVLGNLAKASFQSLGESGAEDEGDEKDSGNDREPQPRDSADLYAFEGTDESVAAGADTGNRNSES